VIWRRDPLPPLDLERREREQALARQTRLNIQPLHRPDPDDWGFEQWQDTNVGAPGAGRATMPTGSPHLSTGVR
jgi:hypothetical protein